MNEYRRVSIFYDVGFPSQSGGGQKRLYHIGQELVREKSQVNWISFRFWGGSNSFTADNITYNGFLNEPEFYDKNVKRNIYEPILYLLNCVFSLKHYIKTDTWIIGQWPLLHIVPLILLGKCLGKQVYVEWWETLQDQWSKRGIAGYIGAVIERMIISFASFVTFVVECESEEDLIRNSNGNAKVKIVRNGVDLEHYSTEPCICSYDFISLGRLVPQKNFELIIRATKIVSVDHDVSLCIVGDGPEKESLGKLTDELGLRSSITITGLIEAEKEKVYLLQSAKVGIVTHSGAGRGNVVVNEMLAAGLPVIAVGSADIGIDRSYLREGATGFFLDSLDENALAGIMTKLLRDRESVEKMRQNLLANQMEYSWSTVLKGYLDGDCA